MKSTLKCSSCRGQSFNHQVFRTLHLGFSSSDEEIVRLNLKCSHQSQDLQALLDRYFAIDEPADVDSVCGQCGARTEVIGYLMVAHMAIILNVEAQE